MPLTLDLSADYAVFDNLEAITYTAVKNAGNVTASIPKALKRALNFKELAASGGVYTSKDGKFIVPTTLLTAASIVPKPADLITDGDGVVWTVLEANTQVFDTVAHCVVRAMAIAYDLRDLVTIKRPTNSQDAAAGRMPTFADLYTSLACRIQEQDGSEQVERGKRLTRKTYTIFLGQQVSVETTDRVMDADSNIYEIKAWRNPDQIGQLMELSVERRWP